VASYSVQILGTIPSCFRDSENGVLLRPAHSGVGWCQSISHELVWKARFIISTQSWSLRLRFGACVRAVTQGVFTVNGIITTCWVPQRVRIKAVSRVCFQ
jgi:hypothetical protein